MPSDDVVEQIRAALAEAPPGTYKRFKGNGTGVEHDIQAHMANLAEVRQRILLAIRAGCFIEVISLRLQLMDYWLRIYFVENALPDSKRDREFGRLLEQCSQLGLEPGLVSRLREFNKSRIAAIHGFVVGHVRYPALEATARASQSLSRDLIAFVLQTTGQVVTTLEGYPNVGDMILNVPAALQNLVVLGEEA